MTNPTRNRIINEVAESIDIPESAYETAKRRYQDIGTWFGRPESRCAVFSPNIYPQGSFRLGTVIKPITGEGGYDLDIGCRLRLGISKATHTQKHLKHLVGAELEAYRVARRVEELMEEKHRCWRLKYADSIQFHIDTVPSIPETEQQRRVILESMVRSGVSNALSGSTDEIDDICSEALAKGGYMPKKPEAIRVERFVEKYFECSAGYEDLPPGAMGYTLFDKRGKVLEVRVSSKLEDGKQSSERRVRSTWAHEAGHCLLHPILFIEALGQPTFSQTEGKNTNIEGQKILCRDTRHG